MTRPDVEGLTTRLRRINDREGLPNMLKLWIGEVIDLLAYIREVERGRDAKDRARLAQKEADRTGLTTTFKGSDGYNYMVDPQTEIMAMRSERDAALRDLETAKGHIRALLPFVVVRKVILPTSAPQWQRNRDRKVRDTLAAARAFFTEREVCCR